nr:ATP synthase F0 subunit 8 [Craspedonirmus immer]
MNWSAIFIASNCVLLAFSVNWFFFTSINKLTQYSSLPFSFKEVKGVLSSGNLFQ